MAGYNPITVAIDSGDMYTNSQLLGVISITGGDNISLDNSGGIINVVQDPCFNSLTINNDVSGNTAKFNTINSDDYLITGTQGTSTNSLTSKDYVDTQLATKQNTITSSTDVVGKSLQIATSINSSIVTSDDYFHSGTQGTSTNSLTRKDYVDTEVATKQDTLTVDTEIIGRGLSINPGANENCILGYTVAGYTGWIGYSGLIHRDLYGSHNPTTYSIVQSSAGKTLVNSAPGQSLNLRIAHVDKFVINSDGSCKAYGELDHKANIFSRTCNGTPTAPSGTIYYPDYNVADFNGNSNIFGTWTTPSATSTTGLQVLKTGYYRIEAKMNWKSITWAERFQVWVRILINNVADDSSSDFCYGRHSAFIPYVTSNINRVVSLTANDWVKFDANLNKNSTTFGFEWAVIGVVDRFGFDCFTITYLGV